MDSGWYPDPDVPDARRYWDGREWSAPLPAAPAAEAPLCVSPGCTQPRLPDRWACSHHQQLAESHWARTGQQPPPGPNTFAAPAPPPPRPINEFAGVVAPTGASAIVCPHCGVRGKVRSRRVKQKKGISGGKATGAVLTAGFSLLATGLSRKESVTELRCGNCRVTWYA